MAHHSLPLHWHVGHHAERFTEPTTWVPAEVPGAVQLDWARAHGWPPYTLVNDLSPYAWMEDAFWSYSCVLPDLGCTTPKDVIYLHLEGVDYQCEVMLDDLTLAHHEGMFSPIRLQLDPASSGKRLRVIIWPAPKNPTQTGRRQADHSCKPAVSYGWDWHPRLIPLGIWQTAQLIRLTAGEPYDFQIRTSLNDDFTLGTCHVVVETVPTTTHEVMEVRLYDPSDSCIQIFHSRPTSTTTHIELKTPNPLLWWCWDQGSPHLYRIEVVLAGRRLVRHCGFRRVRLVMNAGGWDYAGGFPKGRSAAPITIELNGRRIFARGSNWVSPEIFPGKACDAETYAPLLNLARAAHFNLLRMWGGSPAQKESFYDRCDRIGMLVWQEFPLACCEYPDDAHYLTILDQESRSLIRRLSQHPSVAMWCGGNELFNAWSGMTDQHLALRLLNKNCYELDPSTPFIPTAPIEGMGHGHYLFRDPNTGCDIFQIMQQARNTAYTEFGCPSISPIDLLKRIIPADELWPPRPGGAWTARHAYGAWDIDPGTWLCWSTIVHYYGEPRDLDALIAASQWLQAEGYRGAFEEARRQWPRASMALNWCFNEPWPSAANNSLINYPCQPKGSFPTISAANRPRMASARIPQFQWRSGDQLSAELWILNDLPEATGPLRVKAWVEIAEQRLSGITWDCPGSPANSHLQGPTLVLELPPTDVDSLDVIVAVEEHPELDSRYRLSLAKKKAVTMSIERLNV